jgi:hypothetical protein
MAGARRRRKARSCAILSASRGTPWAEGFDRAALGDEDLHFHDLRGTAVTRLALSGCTVPEIAAPTGHSPRDVEAILEAHYLGGRVENAVFARFEYPDDLFDGDFTEFAGREEDLFTWFSLWESAAGVLGCWR